MPMKPERDKRTNQSSEENTRKPIRERERSSFQKQFSLTGLWIHHENCNSYSLEQKFCITRTKLCKYAIPVTSFQASKCDKYAKKNHKIKLKVPVLKTFRNCSISLRYDFWLKHSCSVKLSVYWIHRLSQILSDFAFQTVFILLWACRKKTNIACSWMTFIWSVLYIELVETWQNLSLHTQWQDRSQCPTAKFQSKYLKSENFMLNQSPRKWNIR